MTRSVAERWAGKVDRSGGPRACWPWVGALSVKRAGTRRGHLRGAMRGDFLLAHRVALCIINGVFWPSLYGLPEQACHTCNNRLCCNPAHLYWGTDVENRADRRRDTARRPAPAPAQLEDAPF